MRYFLDDSALRKKGCENYTFYRRCLIFITRQASATKLAGNGSHCKRERKIVSHQQNGVSCLRMGAGGSCVLP
jgi:hypothetical protein